VPLDGPYPIQVLMAVPKKKVNKASQRNWQKRRIKEAYRLNKSSHYPYFSEKGIQCALALVFVGKELVPYEETEKKIKEILEKLPAEHAKHP